MRPSSRRVELRSAVSEGESWTHQRTVFGYWVRPIRVTASSGPPRRRASLRPATPGQRGLQRQGTVRLQPLLDEVLGPNHINVVIQGPAARSAAHTHDCDQVLVVVDGTARIETEWEQHDLPTGSVLLIPPRGCARACHDRRRRCGIHPVHPHRTRHHPVGVASYPSRATSPATGDTLGLSRGRGCHRRQCHVRSRVAPGALRWSATALQDVLTLRCGGRRRWC